MVQPSNASGEPEDPHGLIGQVLAMGDEFPGPAGDVLLSWLLQLKDRMDPATAAKSLIERHGLADCALPPGPLGELVRLLRETAQYPPERLGELASRRRGGRRGRTTAGL
jgi:hypothetical protein